MDFYSAQDEARARSRRLLGLFGVAVLTTVLAVHFGVETLLAWQSERQFVFRMHWEILPWTAGITLLPMLLGVLSKRLSLSDGGAAVAEAMGGRRVATDTSDFLEKRLLNVVEEVAIASGVRVPEVWVLEGEAGINAFAAGLDASQAVVAVSRGCLETLTREELQGVVGHEFSHILNGDMRLNFEMLTWISGILVLSILGQILIRLAPHLGGSTESRRSSSRSKSGADSLPLLLFLSGVGLLVVGSVGAFFARWIQAAISRQREFLADASAVQFTRNPQGICGALKKIGGYEAGSRLEAARSEEVAHMLFCESTSSWFAGLFATHPPLSERIIRLEPAWGGEMLRGDEKTEIPSDGEGLAVSGFHGGAYVESREVLQSLPQKWVGLARDPGSSGRVILGLLQAVEAEKSEGGGLEGCSVVQQMALLDLALSAARRLPSPAVENLLESCERQVVSDGVLNIFEMMLLQSIRRHLGVAAGIRQSPATQYSEASSLREPFRVVLSAAAALGGGDVEQLDSCFERGWQGFNLGVTVRLPVEDIPVLRIVEALSEIEKGSSALRGTLVHGCYAAVSSDGTITDLEAAFVRAVGDAVGVPVPPPRPEGLRG